jgi:hypothetical protein
MTLLDLGSREARCKEEMDRAQAAVSDQIVCTESRGAKW